MSMNALQCPKCQKSLDISPKRIYCSSGHEYSFENGFIDLLSQTTDSALLEEEQHWNNVAEQNKMSIDPSKFINIKTFDDYCKIYKRILDKEIPDHTNKHLNIGEIGCGSGSALEYFGSIGFRSVDYIGIDVSSKLLQKGLKRKIPKNWNINFVRASANDSIFTNDFFDIIFSSAALHHLDLEKSINHISKSLRKKGILILTEPSNNNPFARIGRNLIEGFHTPGEKPLKPKQVKQCAKEYGLYLIFEKGLHFINGPMQYLIGIKRVPKYVELSLYYVAKYIDKIVTSPSLSYSFIQGYKKQ